MEGIEIRGKDVIVHEEMTEEERNAELERLKRKRSFNRMGRRVDTTSQ